MVGITMQADRQDDAHHSEASPVKFVALKTTYRTHSRWLPLLILLPLLGALGYHFSGVLQDAIAALGYKFALDYGEGIVWQQALLMFGPEMYSPSPDLPFIVFHYTPLYHFVVRALLYFHLDGLFAGRLISVLSSAASAILIGALTLMSFRGRPTVIQFLIALASGLLFLCLNPVRTWGVWMRVDMLAIALGLAGTLVAARTRCGTLGTTIGLLLCVASVFTKQTQLAAGVSIFVIAVICKPRSALIAASIAGFVGLVCLAALELTTHGFLKNIILYNINPIEIATAISNLIYERESAPYAFAMLISALVVATRFVQANGMRQLRECDPTTITQALVTLHFGLACLTAMQILKQGSSNNYFLDLMAVGCVLIGVLLNEFSSKPLRFALLSFALAVTTMNLQYRSYLQSRFAIWTKDNERLVQKIESSPKPVSSDDMVVVLRSGKSVVFEPAIVRALIETGGWDPTALLKMFHDHYFAFAITVNGTSKSGALIDQAIAESYPIAEQATPNLVIHAPGQSN